MGCGCQDTPCKGITSPCPPGYVDCPKPECEEYNSAQCVVYTGPDIPYLNIVNGERMDVIIQKLLQAISNFSGADNPSNICKAVYGIRSGALTTTSIQIYWEQPDVDLSYQVEYQAQDAGAEWTVFGTPVTGDTATITGLEPDTYYNIRIRSVCNNADVVSITIVLNTLSE